MSGDAARRELAELADGLLSRGKPDEMQFAILVDALGRIARAFGEAQERCGDWAALRAELRAAMKLIDAVFGMHPLDPRWAAFVGRQRGNAATLLNALERGIADGPAVDRNATAGAKPPRSWPPEIDAEDYARALEKTREKEAREKSRFPGGKPFPIPDREFE